jgi:methylthioribose-1-phosphate isomerase
MRSAYPDPAYGGAVRTIDWADGQVVLIDQTRLPAEERRLHITEVDDLIGAIRRLAVRGAPALGAAGALGVLLARAEADRAGWDDATLHDAIARLRAARPTAVNLARAGDPVGARAEDGAAGTE